jgi:hypothetical protein
MSEEVKSNVIPVDFTDKTGGVLGVCISEFLKLPFVQSILHDITLGRELSLQEETLVEGIENHVAVAVYKIFEDVVNGR